MFFQTVKRSSRVFSLGLAFYPSYLTLLANPHPTAPNPQETYDYYEHAAAT